MVEGSGETASEVGELIQETGKGFRGIERGSAGGQGFQGREIISLDEEVIQGILRVGKGFSR